MPKPTRGTEKLVRNQAKVLFIFTYEKFQYSTFMQIQIFSFWQFNPETVNRRTF